MSVKKIIIVSLVVCVGAILVFPMFEAMTSHHKHHVYYKARTNVSQIRYAFMALIMYNHAAIDVLPLNQNFQLDGDPFQIITGNPPENLGWRNTIYIDESGKEMVDRWGQPYWCRIEQMANTNHIFVKAWSAGPNKRNDNGEKDDINSWGESNPRKWRLNKFIYNCCSKSK